MSTGFNKGRKVGLYFTNINFQYSFQSFFFAIPHALLLRHVKGAPTHGLLKRIEKLNPIFQEGCTQYDEGKLDLY